MKILQINATYGRGSTGTIVKDIMTLCEKRGIECFVAYGAGGKENDKYLYYIGNPVVEKFHALWTRLIGRQAYASWFSTWRFLHYLDRIQPDVVQLHNLHSNYINLRMLLRYLAKKDIKTVVTLHDCWFYTGGCSHYVQYGCERWKVACGDCPAKRGIPSWAFDGSSHVIADRRKYFRRIPRLVVTGVSEWIRSEAVSGIFAGVESYTIYNGIDLSVFKPIEVPRHKRIQNLLKQTAGRKIILGPASKWFLPENKQTLDYFVANMTKDEVLVIFGCESFREGLSEKVIQFGFTTDREELAELYSLAAVFVNCTRAESLSLINVEAQACGTPVVTYDGTGVQETVDEKCGFAVRSGDHEQLFKTTQEVLAQGKQSELCRNWVASKFEVNSNYEQYLKLY